MIQSIRIEAIGDTPDGTRAYFLKAFERLGLGWGEVEDEVYQRNEIGGYDGRIKMKFEVGMPQRVEQLWFQDAPHEDIAEEWNRDGSPTGMPNVVLPVIVNGILWEVRVPTGADVPWIKRAAFTEQDHFASTPKGVSIDDYELRDAQGNLMQINDQGQVFSAPQPLTLVLPAGYGG